MCLNYKILNNILIKSTFKWKDWEEGRANLNLGKIIIVIIKGKGRKDLFVVLIRIGIIILKILGFNEFKF